MTIKYRVVTDIGPIHEFGGTLGPNLYDAQLSLVNGFLAADVAQMEFDKDMVLDHLIGDDIGYEEVPWEFSGFRREDIKLPAFRLGEILIVDGQGIEYGHFRKTWKFDVGYEEFGTIEEALECQKMVLGIISPGEIGTTWSNPWSK